MRRVMNEMYMKEVTSVYGLTESSPGMTQSDITDSLEDRSSTVGRPFPGVDVRVADPASCEELPRGTVGEVLCRGYNVMKGYYKMPEATQEAVTPEGWLHSGDLGVMDERGYLRITGRIKDMIIRGGENIYPREVEEYLMGLEGVRDVQVVGVPSRKYGEEVGAFIVPKEGYEPVNVEDVREFCRGKIAWHKVPRYVAILEEFPMTGSGKIQKYKLREMAAELFPEPSEK
jgi:fatty-acyl-CoA synthase